MVGFYVCLTGPSWDTAKVALFSSAAPAELLGELWGYQPMLSLRPQPTMCATLMCDRGEYLSKAAKITGAKLIPCMSYAPPYRPDLKGLVEVLHRITKDHQYFFTPGAIDQRRAEYELRNSDPNESVLTLKEYVAYLYSVFTEYNLTAPRHHRVDAHMHGAGVFPSPAGLWRYGHEKGIGVRRHIPLDKLISDLLPSETARVTRQGVRFTGKEYRSDVVDEQQWTALARNFGGWDFQASYFPGSVSRIWTPQTGTSGLLELSLSDHSNASEELTFDECLDAETYSKCQNAEYEHINNTEILKSRQRAEEIMNRAREYTREACEKQSGGKPSMSQARGFETNSKQHSSETKQEEIRKVMDEAEQAHHDMMRAIFAEANA